MKCKDIQNQRKITEIETKAKYLAGSFHSCRIKLVFLFIESCPYLAPVICEIVIEKQWNFGKRGKEKSLKFPRYLIHYGLSGKLPFLNSFQTYVQLT